VETVNSRRGRFRNFHRRAERSSNKAVEADRVDAEDHKPVVDLVGAIRIR
jgi:hypothetical protein